MQAASWDDKLRGIKISRLDVAMILAEAAIACRSADGIARLFTKLSG
jgi:farnesyl-diphosphate farnesyltransferase